MANITAKDVNELRKMTGVGMMDCKNALVEADGDFDKAIDILRKKGQKVAAKRADRASNEGRAIAKTNTEGNFAAVLAIGCETDFVGKNADFVAMSEMIIDNAIAQKVKTKEELVNLTINGRTVAEHLLDMTGKTGEKVELAAYNVIEAACASAYNHNGNKLAVIVAFNKQGADVPEIAHNVAMQIAAMSPISLDATSIPQATIDHELEVARDTVRQEGKPENMVEKIAQGKLNKFFKENTLLSQDYIDDNKISVDQYIKKNDKELACTGFFRVQLGA